MIDIEILKNSRMVMYLTEFNNKVDLPDIFSVGVCKEVYEDRIILTNGQITTHCRVYAFWDINDEIIYYSPYNKNMALGEIKSINKKS